MGSTSNIWGESGYNVLEGGTGNDIIHGGQSVDQIYGGNGNDRLYGNTGNDVIKGGNGYDLIVGGLGTDQLWGGDDPDRFAFCQESSAQAAIDEFSITDTIHDFQNDFDKIITDFAYKLVDARSGTYIRLDEWQSVFVKGITSADLADDIVLA